MMAMRAARKNFEEQQNSFDVGGNYRELPKLYQNQKTIEGWSVRMNLFQVVSAAVVTLVAMVFVFKFGVNAGYQMGIEHALKEKGHQLVKLPVIRPEVAIEDSIEETQEITETLAAGEEEVALAVSDEKTTEEEFSFAKEAEQPIVAKEEVVEKVAEEEIVKTTPVVEAKVESATPEKEPETKLNSNEEKLTAGFVEGWYVQIASFPANKDAEDLVSKLREKGVIARRQNLKVDSKEYFRVLDGPFVKEETAKKEQTRIVALGISEGVPFVKYFK
jgi:cell division septation protein DedD